MIITPSIHHYLQQATHPVCDHESRCSLCATEKELKAFKPEPIWPSRWSSESILKRAESRHMEKMKRQRDALFSAYEINLNPMSPSFSLLEAMKRKPNPDLHWYDFREAEKEMTQKLIYGNFPRRCMTYDEVHDARCFIASDPAHGKDAHCVIRGRAYGKGTDGMYIFDEITFNPTNPKETNMSNETEVTNLRHAINVQKTVILRAEGHIRQKQDGLAVLNKHGRKVTQINFKVEGPGIEEWIRTEDAGICLAGLSDWLPDIVALQIADDKKQLATEKGKLTRLLNKSAAVEKALS